MIGSFAKRRQRDYLDAQVFARRDCNVTIALCLIVLGLIAAFVLLSVNFIPASMFSVKTSQDISKPQRKQIVLPATVVEDKAHMCVGWRDMDGCILDGSRTAQNDLNCSDLVSKERTGWCECRDHSGSMFQIYFDCPSVAGSDRHEVFTCANMCSQRAEAMGGHNKQLGPDSTRQRESLIQIERRRREVAERERLDREAKEEAERPLRAHVKRGDDLISEVYSDIQEKHFSLAMEKLSQARQEYELGGAIVDEERTESVKGPITGKELTVNQATTRLREAMAEDMEQARLWREKMEAERIRQEAAIREAALEVERLQLLHMEELRQRQQREIMEAAQREAMELMGLQSAMRDEDMRRQQMSAEELSRREMGSSDTDDAEAVEAQRRYAEFMQRRRRLLDGSGVSAAQTSAPTRASPPSQAPLADHHSHPHHASAAQFKQPEQPAAEVPPTVPAAAAEVPAPEQASAPQNVKSDTETAAVEPAVVETSAMEAGAAAEPVEPLIIPPVVTAIPMAPTESPPAPVGLLGPVPAASSPSSPAQPAAEDSQSAAPNAGTASDTATVGKGKEEQEGTDTDPALYRALKAAGLATHLEVLRDAGVDTLYDVRFLDERIIGELPVPSESKRSLLRFARAFARR